MKGYTMSKKKDKVKKGNNEEHGPELNPDIDEFLAVPQGAPGDFQDFFEKRLGEVYEIQLYKVTETETIWLKKYNSIVPDRTLIASTWGGGEYRAYGKTKGVRGTCMKRLRISEWWDGESARLRAEEQKKLAGSGMQVQASGIDDTCKIINAIAPLFKTLSERPNKPASGSEQINEINMAWTKNQIDLIKKLKELALNDKEPDPALTGPVTEEPGMIEKTVQEGLRLLVDWGGNFMKTRGTDRDKAVNTIKSDPRFSKIMGNQELIKSIYDKGCAHKKIGVKMMNEFFQSCGCDLEEKTPA